MTTAPESRTSLPAFSRADYLLALLAGCAALIVYLLTLAPTVSGEDSGELITAAATLGIPHPPGYPLWCLVGKFFTFFPVGSIAWRVNLSSAVCAAATVSLVLLLVVYVTRMRLAAFMAALAFAFSHEFWEQAVIAEVYALNALLMAACLILLLRWRDTRNDRLLLTCALLFGLGLSNHNTFVLFAPVVAGYVLWADGFSLRRWRVYLAACALCAAGLLVYFYLPLASLRNPPMDWGNPETARGFYEHVTRKQLSFMYWQYPRSVERTLLQWAYCGRFWVLEYTAWVTPVWLAGLWLLWRRSRSLAVLTLVTGVVVVAGFAFIQNFNFDREWLWVMSVFGIPAYLVTALWLGEALAALGRRAGALPALALGMVCAASPLVAYWDVNDKSEYYWTADYARNVLESLAPDAIYISESDHASFGAVYLQAIEHVRPDVAIGRKYGYLSPELMAAIPAEKRNPLWGDKPAGRYESAIFEALLENTARPVYFERGSTLSPESAWRLDPCALVQRAVPKDAPASGGNCWADYRWRNGLERCAARGDNTADIIRYDVHMARANDAFVEQNWDGGLAELAEAVDAYGEEVQSLNNAGAVCARFGGYVEAAEYFRRALAADPDSEVAAANLFRVRRCLKGKTEP